MRRKLLVFLNQKCLSVGASIVLFCGFIFASAAYFHVDRAFDHFVNMVDEELDREFRRSVLYMYKMNFGLMSETPLPEETREHAEQRIKKLHELEQKWGIGDEEVNGREALRSCSPRGKLIELKKKAIRP